MADISRLSTPITNKNIVAPTKEHTSAAGAAVDFQDMSKVLKMGPQSEMLQQNNGNIEQQRPPSLMMDLMTDPKVTVGYIRSIMFLQEIVALLPQQNQSFTEEIQQLFAKLHLSPAQLTGEMVQQENASTAFKGELFDFLRNVLSESPAPEMKSAVLQFLKAVNSETNRSDILAALSGSFSYLAKELAPSKALAAQLADVAAKFQQGAAEPPRAPNAPQMPQTEQAQAQPLPQTANETAVPQQGQTPLLPENGVPQQGQTPLLPENGVPPQGQTPLLPENGVPPQGQNPLPPENGVPPQGQNPLPPENGIPQQGQNPLPPENGIPQQGQNPLPPENGIPQQGQNPLPPENGIPQQEQNPLPPENDVPQQGQSPLPPENGIPQQGQNPLPPENGVPQQGQNPLPPENGVPPQGQNPLPPENGVPQQGQTPLPPENGVPQQGQNRLPFSALQHLANEALGNVEKSILFTDKTARLVSLAKYNLSRYNSNTDFLEEASNQLLELLPPESKTELLQNLFTFLTRHQMRQQAVQTGEGDLSGSQVMNALTDILEKQTGSKPMQEVKTEAMEGIVHSILSSPSNFTPLLHFLLPVQDDDTTAMAEMWVNPDEEDTSMAESAGTASIHMLVVFDIDALGRFETEIFAKDKELRLSVYCPPDCAELIGGMTGALRTAVTASSYRVKELAVKPLEKPRSLVEVFPALPQKRTGLYAKI